MPLGVDPAFFEHASPDHIAAVRARYGLAEGYLLYAGQWKGYKNLDLLLDLMESLRGTECDDLELVLVGKEDPRERLGDRLTARGLTDRVRVTGFVPDEDLVALYQGAMLFLFPSRYEGFGLPALEAMAAGVPVVASDRASIPEVVGPAGVLLDPERMLEWQNAVRSLSADPARREQLARAGRERACGFRWDLTAERTVEAYRRALGDSFRYPQGASIESSPGP